MASLVATIMIGSISKANVKAPANTLFPIWKTRTNISRPSSPYMIDGTPAKFEIFTSRREDNRLFLPYSSKYTPAATASGKAISVVKPNIHSEPVQAVYIPAFSAFLDGRLFMKSQSILDSPSTRILPIKIARTTSPKKVQIIPMYSKILSLILFFLELVILLSKFLSYPEADII